MRERVLVSTESLHLRTQRAKVSYLEISRSFSNSSIHPLDLPRLR